jgi:hypothetical protein
VGTDARQGDKKQFAARQNRSIIPPAPTNIRAPVDLIAVIVGFSTRRSGSELSDAHSVGPSSKTQFWRLPSAHSQEEA